MKTRDLLQALLDESRYLVEAQSLAAFDAFRPALADCDRVYRDCGSQMLPAAGQLDKLLAMASPAAEKILGLLNTHSRQLFWEQSYKQVDNLVPQAMLDGYGFVEFAGKRGPFVTEAVRCGIGLWGPDIVYPTHRHQAREIYLVLAGGAEFSVGESGPFYASADRVISVSSGVDHGFRTLQQPLAVFYLWQGGDLRETSTFD